MKGSLKLNGSGKGKKQIFKSELVQIQELDSKDSIEQVSSPDYAASNSLSKRGSLK